MTTKTLPRENATQVHLLLSIEEVAAHFGVDRVTIWRMVRDGKFPPPLRFGRRLVRWSAARLNEFIEAGCRM